MNFSEISVASAGIDFVENVWPTLFPGKRGSRNREYMKVRAFVLYVRKHGSASNDWTARILKQYGGEGYRVSTSFEVAIQNPCIYCGSECREVNVFSEEFRGQTLTYAKYVCTADPNHFWQSGKQMDETQANGPAFKEALENIWAENEGEEIETKI